MASLTMTRRTFAKVAAATAAAAGLGAGASRHGPPPQTDAGPQTAQRRSRRHPFRLPRRAARWNAVCG